jgi:hypothetical protein
MQTLNIEQINEVSGGADGQACASSIIAGGGRGFGIGATFGALVGGPAGAVVGGLIGSLIGGAVAANTTPECKAQ